MSYSFDSSYSGCGTYLIKTMGPGCLYSHSTQDVGPSVKTHKNVKIYILQKFDLVPGWSIAYLTANPHSYSGDLNTGQVPNSVEKANGWNLHGIDFSISRKIGVVCYYKGRKWFELQAYELAI